MCARVRYCLEREDDKALEVMLVRMPIAGCSADVITFNTALSFMRSPHHIASLLRRMETTGVEANAQTMALVEKARAKPPATTA